MIYIYTNMKPYKNLNLKTISIKKPPRELTLLKLPF